MVFQVGISLIYIMIYRGHCLLRTCKKRASSIRYRLENGWKKNMKETYKSAPALQYRLPDADAHVEVFRRVVHLVLGPQYVDLWK